MKSWTCYGYPPARTADWRLRVFYLAVACFLICLGSRKETAAQDLDKSLGGALTCVMIEDAARSNSLPVSFFTRLLWQESGFQSDAIGPVTRSGARALGIAQFMPATAAERGLLEPFNPVEALPKSGRFLAELRYQFGNLGLAAAAYNAGPQRVREFLAGSRNLPSETRNYVFKITGHSVDDWRVDKRRSPDEEVRLDLSQLDEGGENCRGIVAKLKKSRSVGLSPPRAVPSWCRHLNQPKSSVCGLVRQQSSAMQTARLANTKSSRVSKILPR
jgi:hypothetical protein